MNVKQEVRVAVSNLIQSFRNFAVPERNTPPIGITVIIPHKRVCEKKI